MKFGYQLGQPLSSAVGLVAVARAALRSLRRPGAFGVVVDPRGVVLGTYLDPYADPVRPSRLHGAGSPWLGGGAAEWAWEGFGRTEQAALARANRLRLRHLRLVPAMLDDGPDPRFRAITSP